MQKEHRVKNLKLFFLIQKVVLRNVIKYLIINEDRRSDPEIKESSISLTIYLHLDIGFQKYNLLLSSSNNNHYLLTAVFF